MGGEGSGRPPSVETIIKRSQPQITPIGDSIFIPNYSGLKIETKKTFPDFQTLTDGATISWSMASGNMAKVTLGGNRTMSAPTNLTAGRNYWLIVIQDGTGSRTITWNSVFKWVGGSAPTLTTTASAIDIFEFICYDGTNLQGVGQFAFS